MKVLILGYSDIARRRVIPALQATSLDKIAVASRSCRVDDSTVTAFRDYDQALRDWQPALVYVSLRNDAHAHWAERALLAGAHVVIDKPATLNPDDAHRLADLATRQQHALAEATVYAWHPQMARLQHWVESQLQPVQARVQFCFPSLPENNFRYRPEHGGGMLHDLGPYAVSIGRLLFGTQPARLQARILSRHPHTGVDLGFELQADYAQGHQLQGRFACGETYRNTLHLQSGERNLHLDRLFTTPPDLHNRLLLKGSGGQQEKILPAADAFHCFFDDLLQAITAGQYRHFTDTLLADADARQRLRNAAEGTLA